MELENIGQKSVEETKEQQSISYVITLLSMSGGMEVTQQKELINKQLAKLMWSGSSNITGPYCMFHINNPWSLALR